MQQYKDVGHVLFCKIFIDVLRRFTCVEQRLEA